MPTQDELIRMLTLGQLGPWGGQGFVPGGITILRPDTMQWETILATPGDADLMTSTLGPVMDMGSTLEWANEQDLEEQGHVTGIPVTIGLPSTVAPSSFGRPLISVVPQGQYTDQHFVQTTLGQIRHSEGISNGANGPLSPIRMGLAREEINTDGNPWLPVVRMHGVDAERSPTSTGRIQ